MGHLEGTGCHVHTVMLTACPSPGRNTLGVTFNVLSFLSVLIVASPEADEWISDIVGRSALSTPAVFGVHDLCFAQGVRTAPRGQDTLSLVAYDALVRTKANLGQQREKTARFGSFLEGQFVPVAGQETVHRNGVVVLFGFVYVENDPGHWVLAPIPRTH